MNATLGQTRKLIEQTDNAGLDLKAMDYLLGSGLYTDLLKFVTNTALRERFDAKKIHEEIQKVYGLSQDSLFASPAVQLEIFMEINRKHRLGFTSNHFAALGATPTDQAQGLVVWTLEAMLETPEKTFVCVLGLMRSPTWEEGVSVQTPSDCRIKGTNSNWSPMTLRWVKIDLGADLGKKPKDVICENSAHIGPMWQAVYSPSWFTNIGKTVGGLEVPEVSLPGFALEYGESGGVPHLEPYRVRQHSLDRSYTNKGVGLAALARYVQ